MHCYGVMLYHICILSFACTSIYGAALESVVSPGAHSSQETLTITFVDETYQYPVPLHYLHEPQVFVAAVQQAANDGVIVPDDMDGIVRTIEECIAQQDDPGAYKRILEARTYSDEVKLLVQLYWQQLQRERAAEGDDHWYDSLSEDRIDSGVSEHKNERSRDSSLERDSSWSSYDSAEDGGVVLVGGSRRIYHPPSVIEGRTVASIDRPLTVIGEEDESNTDELLARLTQSLEDVGSEEERKRIIQQLVEALVARARVLMKNEEFAQAVGLLTQAAEQGYVEAQFLLGEYYQNSDHSGLDYERAARWLTRATQNEHATATFLLGKLYYHGKGVKRNHVYAAELFEKVLLELLDDPEVLFYCGWCYLCGPGKIRDSKLGKALLKKAVDDGNELAGEVTRRLSKMGTVSHIKSIFLCYQESSNSRVKEWVREKVMADRELVYLRFAYLFFTEALLTVVIKGTAGDCAVGIPIGSISAAVMGIVSVIIIGILARASGVGLPGVNEIAVSGASGVAVTGALAIIGNDYVGSSIGGVLICLLLSGVSFWGVKGIGAGVSIISAIFAVLVSEDCFETYFVVGAALAAGLYYFLHRNDKSFKNGELIEALIKKAKDGNMASQSLLRYLAEVDIYNVKKIVAKLGFEDDLQWPEVNLEDSFKESSHIRSETDSLHHSPYKEGVNRVGEYDEGIRRRVRHKDT